MPSFRVPACVDTFRLGEWLVRQHEPLPPFHRRTEWQPQRIREVASDASGALEAVLVRPLDIPAHWRPIHGDLVPWNLREDDQGQLWLLDWEDAGWGPPLADLVRFIVAYYSLGWSGPARIADRVREALAGQSAEAIHEVATFWLQHRNFRPDPAADHLPGRRRDAARGAREFSAFRVLAEGAQPIAPGAVTSDGPTPRIRTGHKFPPG